MKILDDNPYRILGVYSNSSTKDRLANFRRMEAFLKVGKPVSCPLDLPPHLLPLVGRTESVVADADARLSLPKDQIRYAQFWFMKVTPLDDVAFNHLMAGDIDKAIDIWSKKGDVSSLQNLVVCHLIRGHIFLAVYYAELLCRDKQNLRAWLQLLPSGLSFTDTCILEHGFLDNLCEEFGVERILRTNDVEKKWPLKEFAKGYEKTQMATLKDKNTGECYKNICFSSAGKSTFVSFGNELGELTVKEIQKNAVNLDVIQLPSGRYEIVPKDLIRGEWRGYIIEKYASRYIQQIANAIENAQSTKGKDADARLKAGKLLCESTKDVLVQLDKLLPSSDLQYQTIVDKLGLEILQCGIDYYNDSDEPDAALKAMELQNYANSIVVGQMAKDRCKENVDILKRIIDNLPPREVYAEDRAIKEELRKYCKLPDKICHAVTLLNNTKPYLLSVKQKLGVTNAYYLKISTLVASNALHNVIEDVNQALKYDPAEERRKEEERQRKERERLRNSDNPIDRAFAEFRYDAFRYTLYDDRKEKYEHVKQIVLEAREALILMDSMDMETEFVQKRYLPNREPLNDMLVQCGSSLPQYKHVSIIKEIKSGAQNRRKENISIEETESGVQNTKKDNTSDNGCTTSWIILIVFCMVLGAIVGGWRGFFWGGFVGIMIGSVIDGIINDK